MYSTRVLVADANPMTRDRLVQYFDTKPDLKVVAQTGNGLQAFHYLMQLDVDVLVMGMIMPGLDGLGLLERLSEQRVIQESLHIIVLSNILRDNLVRRAVRLGADYFMAKPFDPEQLYHRVLESAMEERALQPYVNPGTDRTLSELERLGLPSHLRGYRFLHTAVALALELGETSGHITKQIYPCVGEGYRVKPSQVERAIRHLIDVGWEQGDLRQLFDHKPTNGELITALARRG